MHINDMQIRAPCRFLKLARTLKTIGKGDLNPHEEILEAGLFIFLSDKRQGHCKRGWIFRANNIMVKAKKF